MKQITTVKYLIPIQSVSDIITNSSSEVFLCQNTTNMTMEQLVDFIYEYNRQHQFEGSWQDWLALSDDERDQYDSSSGTGGMLEVVSYEKGKDDWPRIYFEGLSNPEQYLMVDTDWNNRATIDWICDNLNARCVD